MNEPTRTPQAAARTLRQAAASRARLSNRSQAAARALLRAGAALLFLARAAPEGRQARAAPGGAEILAPPGAEIPAAGTGSTRPGLVLTLETRGTPAARDARVARLAALQVAAGERPSPFLPPGPFRALWEGFLELDFLDDYTFSLEGSGGAELLIDGETILTADGSTPLERVAPRTVELDEGKRRLSLRYESPPEGDAEVRLLWASLDFAPEPVPPAALNHDPSHPLLRERSLLRRGRELLAAHRCLSCHEPGGEPGLAPALAEGMPELRAGAPILDGIGSRLREAWIAAWIEDPRAHRSAATMPKLLGSGGEARRRARDIARYLASLGDGEAHAPDPAVLPEKAAPEEGERLFTSLGCLGCHTAGTGPATPDDDRFSLAHVRAKWQPRALPAFLLEPARHYPGTPMPSFRLDPTEAEHLARFLLESAAPASGASDAPLGDAAQGRTEIETAGCLGCHQLSGALNRSHPPPLARLLASRLDTGCLAERAGGRPGVPDFDWSLEERAALRAFLAGGIASLGAYCPLEYAERQVRALRCRGCHIRDGALDAWSRAVGSTMPAALPPGTLPPAAPLPAGPGAEPRTLQDRPRLTWTGEKLRADWLERFLAGEIREPVRPWLEARMPVFSLDARLVARGLAAEHGFGAETKGGEAEPPPALDPVVAAAAERLLGKDQGFDCLACHDLGERRSTGAFDARGPDLLLTPSRVRKRFALRWLRDPQRVTPGTRMPQFASDGRSPFMDLLGGDARRQFEAIWEYLRARAAAGGR